jgi:hypothetical protein
MPYFLVDIRGDALRAMGLLAHVGIQNLVSSEAPSEHLTARLSADSPENAQGRVLAALGGEPFTVEDVQLEE